MSLQDKVAIVTGASRGIGRAIALRLAKEGADIVVTATTFEGASKVAGEIEQLGRKAVAIALNVAEIQECEGLVKATLDKFSRLNILVNNAGVTGDNLLVRMKEEEWDKVLDVNLKGTFNCIRAATKTLMKQRAGKIVNITSVIGIIGNAGQANYCASKAGVIGLTKSVAKELASRNIQVNAVAPGYIETDMTDQMKDKAREDIIKGIPMKRLGNISDIAAACLFLASDEANYITGQTLVIDGGMAI